MLKATQTRITGSPFSLKELAEAGNEAILAAGLAAFEQEMGREGHAYFTFLDDGFKNSIVTLIVSDHFPDHILVTAEQVDMDRAINWVENMNSHLQFNPLSAVDHEDERANESLKIHKLFFSPGRL